MQKKNVFQLTMLAETGMEEEAIEMAALGTERFSASVGLWKKRLELHIAREEPVKQLQKLLKQAQIAVSAKVTYIKKFGNPYCCSNNNKTMWFAIVKYVLT